MNRLKYTKTLYIINTIVFNGRRPAFINLKLIVKMQYFLTIEENLYFVVFCYKNKLFKIKSLKIYFYIECNMLVKKEKDPYFVVFCYKNKLFKIKV